MRILQFLIVSHSLAVTVAAQDNCPPVRIASQPPLAHAIANGKERLQVLIAAKTGSSAQVARRVAELGGRVLVRFDSVDYLRAELPVSRYVALCHTPEVLALMPNGYKRPSPYRADNVSRREDPMTAFGKEVEKRQMKPAVKGTLRPLTAEMLTPGNPYLPIHQVGALALRELEPRADGRGVTIANMEGLFDPAHPTMRGALDLTGRPIGKIAGVIDAIATEDLLKSDATLVSGAPSSDGTLVLPDTSANADAKGTFSFRKRDYHAPVSGQYSIGRYKRDGIERIVIWTRDRKVWIDTNTDADLRDERALSEIGTTTDAEPSYTTLRQPTGQSSKKTATRTVLVQFDPAGRLHVYVPVSSHATMTSSTSAGSNFLGGKGGSVAPAARLMLVNMTTQSDDYFGILLGQYVESWILAARDPRVDVLTVSDTYEITPHGAGESVPGIIFERLARVYGKVFLFAADNQGMLGHPTVQSPSPLTLSVGAYFGGETLEALYGWRLSTRDNVATYSSGGPAIDGAFKPDFVAPTMSLAADDCNSTDRNWSLVDIPKCYMIGGGTSNATPFAAGSAAALISAAKLHRLPTDARHIAWALRAGARSFENAGIAEAGAGILQLDRSWELLQKAPEIPDVQVSAPIERLDALYLDTPGRGSGLILEDGWWVGRNETRQISIAIPSTKSRQSYKLRWRGNDGTFAFAQPREQTIDAGSKADVLVRVSPKAPGMHAAAIEVVEKKSDLPVALVAVAVVAAVHPDSTNNYVVEQQLSNKWPNAAVSFVNVPSGSNALRLDLMSRGGKICHATMQPSSTGFDASDVSTWHFWNTFTKGDARATTVSRPFNGAWQFRIEPCGEHFAYNRVPDSVQYHVPLEATGRWSVYAGSIGDVQVKKSAGQDASITMTVRNLGAALQHPQLVAAVGAVIGQKSGDVSDSPIQYNVWTDSSASNLYVSLDIESTESNDSKTPPLVDLYLYKCVKGSCKIAQMRPTPEWHKVIRIVDPTAGSWKVLIVPVGAAGRYRYRSEAVATANSYGTATATLATADRFQAKESRSGTVLVKSGANAKNASRVVLVDLIDEALNDPPRKRYARVQTGAFLDWPPVPVATALLRGQ